MKNYGRRTELRLEIAAGVLGGLAAAWVLSKMTEETARQKAKADPLIHYARGGLLGAVYAAAAARFPVVASGRGAPYGTSVWLGTDQPAPPSTHVVGLAAHLVYGGVLDSVYRFTRGALYAFAGEGTRRPHTSRTVSVTKQIAEAPR